MRLTKAQWEVLFILNPKNGKRPWMTAAQIAEKRAGAAKAKRLGPKKRAAYIRSTDVLISGLFAGMFVRHRDSGACPSTTRCKFSAATAGADLVRKRREREGEK